MVTVLDKKQQLQQCLSVLRGEKEYVLYINFINFTLYITTWKERALRLHILLSGYGKTTRLLLHVFLNNDITSCNDQRGKRL